MNVAQSAPRLVGLSRHDRTSPSAIDTSGALAKAGLTAVEQRILWHLQANARISNADLAEKVALSPSPCWRKVRGLEERGIISRYSAIVDPTAIGLSVEALVSITLERQSASDRTTFEATALSYSEVADMHVVSGEADYQLRVLAADTRALAHLLDTLSAITGVRSLRSQIILSSVRRTSSVAVSLPAPV